MSPEEQKPSENIYRHLSTAIAIAGVYLLSNLAFSSRVRDEIIGRAGNRSEVSGKKPPTGVSLHASHLNHDQSSPYYDIPENGKAMLPHEHLNFHLKHVGKAHEIGLSEVDNNSAIDLLKSVVKKQARFW